MKTSLRDRFDAKHTPEPNSGCWLWHGSTLPDGYGSFWVVDRVVKAPRVAYELYVGPVPEDMHVCHRCDVPACVNPDHLWLGTHAENMADKIAKRRHSIKISPEQVNAIRRLCSDGLSQREIAKRFGVGQTAVSNIRTGKTHMGVAS